MSRETLEIKESGMLTTVQDLGRHGYQRFGVPVCGAMDPFALRIANALVGNDLGSAGLEMTVLGPKVRFLVDTWIAVTGANLSPALDGEPLPMWECVKVTAESVLSFSGVSDGLRGYLAVAGGIDVPVVMGSRSTYLKGAIGGLEGRPLKPGDVLSSLEVEPGPEPEERGLPGHLSLPTYGHRHEIRVILGPQDKAFTPAGIATLLNSEYKVSVQSDRMGYRFEGPTIESSDRPDIVSDGIPLGAVQVPGDGLPIILLADRGTTGGYAKIATVISSDIGTLGQAMPGDVITFKSVSMEEAYGILREQEQALSSVVASHEDSGTGADNGMIVGDRTVEVRDEEGDTIAIPKISEESEGGTGHNVRATIEGRDFDFRIDFQQKS